MPPIQRERMMPTTPLPWMDLSAVWIEVWSVVSSVATAMPAGVGVSSVPARAMSL